MQEPFRCAVVGGTGYVGQRLIQLLEKHPWFVCSVIVAGPRSQGLPYAKACEGRWKLPQAMPAYAKELRVHSPAELEAKARDIDFVFCAVDMEAQALIQLEERMAQLELPVISNNSANRWTPDVPLMIPELNPDHLALIHEQRKRLGTKHGFIVTKPNCSVQSFLPAIAPLRDLGLKEVFVTTFQAVSGCGRRLEDFTEIQGNVIPYISGEEEKTECEPQKIFGHFEDGQIHLESRPAISSQCLRVPVQEGHLAAIKLRFQKHCDANEILMRWRSYRPLPQRLGLPSAPKPFLRYLEADDRPQPRLDADDRAGMGITLGGLREDPILDYKFTCLSHNTIRGAAGGSILTAELLAHEGYLRHQAE